MKLRVGRERRKLKLIKMGNRLGLLSFVAAYSWTNRVRNINKLQSKMKCRRPRNLKWWRCWHVEEKKPEYDAEKTKWFGVESDLLSWKRVRGGGNLAMKFRQIEEVESTVWRLKRGGTSLCKMLSDNLPLNKILVVKATTTKKIFFSDVMEKRGISSYWFHHNLFRWKKLRLWLYGHTSWDL